MGGRPKWDAHPTVAPSLSLRFLQGQGGDFDFESSVHHTESQKPHPFDFAQGKLCRKKRDKDWGNHETAV
jgi:hypothetical protein